MYNLFTIGGMESMLDIQIELLKAQHTKAVTQLANNPLVSKTSGVPPNCDVGVVNGWVLQNRATTMSNLTFVITVNKQIAGCCILKRIDWKNQKAELSYWLGVDFWGKGIATKAAALLRDFAFDVLDLSCLYAHFLKINNVASGRILTKLGFMVDKLHTDEPVSDEYPEFTNDVWTFVVLPRFDWRIKVYSYKQQLCAGMQRSQDFGIQLFV